MVDLFEALANPARREILVMLRAKDMTAGEIAERLTLAKSTLSQVCWIPRSAREPFRFSVNGAEGRSLRSKIEDWAKSVLEAAKKKKNHAYA